MESVKVYDSLLESQPKGVFYLKGIPYVEDGYEVVFDTFRPKSDVFVEFGGSVLRLRTDASGFCRVKLGLKVGENIVRFRFVGSSWYEFKIIVTNSGTLVAGVAEIIAKVLEKSSDVFKDLQVVDGDDLGRFKYLYGVSADSMDGYKSVGKALFLLNGTVNGLFQLVGGVDGILPAFFKVGNFVRKNLVADEKFESFRDNFRVKCQFGGGLSVYVDNERFGRILRYTGAGVGRLYVNLVNVVKDETKKYFDEGEELWVVDMWVRSSVSVSDVKVGLEDKGRIIVESGSYSLIGGVWTRIKWQVMCKLPVVMYVVIPNLYLNQNWLEFGAGLYVGQNNWGRAIPSVIGRNYPVKSFGVYVYK